MKSKRARTVLTGCLLLATGLVVAVVGLGVRSGVRPPVVDLSRPGAESRTRIEQALAGKAQSLEPQAAAAGRIRELQAALDMGADRATCQDLLDNEDWWAKYRAGFPLSAIIADDPLAIVGPGATGLADSEIVRRAREHGAASGILPGNGRAFVAAAASVSLNARRGMSPVVLLANLLDGAALKAVADLTGDTVGLSDGGRLLEAGGAAEPGRTLSPLVGHESAGPLLLGNNRVGTAWSIGGGLWLLAAFRAPTAPPTAEGGGTWALAVGVFLVLLGVARLIVRRAQPASGRAPPLSDRVDTTPLAAAGIRLPDSRSGHAARDPGVGEGLPLPMSFAGERAHGLDTGEGDSASRGAGRAYAINPTTAPSAPTRMGRYELIERIGEGGMAEIFFAAARGAENFVRYFVVKRMHPQLARNQEAVNQFIDEGRLQSGLVHSNIVPVFDFGKAEGEYFLALEYIHGKDVGQIVQRHLDQFGRSLDMGLAFYIVHDVLEALAYAHSQTAKDGSPMEIVHRDVSPGNVLVSYRGEVKLTDFGIAKSDRRMSRTEVGMVKGNASFMSPEQARGEAVDVRSDIFSAGLMLFYCLTSQFLYRGETTLNRLLRAAVGPATSQFDHIDQLPLAAAKVLRRALALDPEKRYPSAVDFARDLIANSAGRSELARLMDQLFPHSLRRDLR